MKPSEYFRRQVRVSAFSYEQPECLWAKSDALYMCCSDYPHSEGTASPITDYEKVDATPRADPAVFHDNVASLLHS